MDDGPDSPILRLLRKLDERGARMEEDIREIKGRLGNLESGYASPSNRLDRLDERAVRIERRAHRALARFT